MKKILLITISIFTFQFSNAQEVETPKKNQFLFNIGTQFSEFDALEKNKTIYLGAEYKFKNDLSLGLKYTYSDLSYSHKGASVLGAPKSNSFQIQFNNDWSEKIGLNTDKFDVYTGVSLGLNFYHYNSFTFPNGKTESGWSNTEYLAGGQIGLRYFITKRLGVHTELNLNNYKNFISTGLTLKL